MSEGAHHVPIDRVLHGSAVLVDLSHVGADALNVAGIIASERTARLQLLPWVIGS